MEGHHEWTAKTEDEKCNWLRRSFEDAFAQMTQTFAAIEKRLGQIEAEQAKLAEALEHETRRSKRAARAR